MSESANIVQVHLGRQVPQHAYDQLGQTRLLNPTTPVYLLMNEKTEVNASRLRDLNVVPILLEKLKPCGNHRAFRRRNRLSKKSLGGFWLYTSERFYAIETFLTACGLRNVVHMENDIMLYANLDELMPAFTACCQHIGVTMDADSRCVPGLVFIRDPESLGAMNDHIVRHALRKTKNDMRAIAHFMNHASEGSCSALPVIPPEYRLTYPLVNTEGERGLKKWYDSDFDTFGGVFDAAALGQFLGGIDPKISEGDTRGFVSETAVYDPRNMGLNWQVRGGLRFPQGQVMDRPFPIYNLHIHSKRLADFSSLAKSPGS